MSRTKGTFSLTSNIEPKFGAPLDARTIVKLKTDLTASGTFDYPYIGLTVFVEEENKKYTLVGSDPTVSTNWIEDNSGGHTIKNPAGTAMTQRSNLQFVDLTVSDDSTNDVTKVENIHVIQSESELDNLPDGLYMLDEDEGTVIDGSAVGYDNTDSGLEADNVQDAIDEVVDTLDDKIDISTKGAANGIAELDSTGKVPSSQLPDSVNNKLEASTLASESETEETTTATKAHAKDSKFYIASTQQYCMATDDIAIGDTLEENTNYVAITINGFLTDLESYLILAGQMLDAKSDKVSSATNGNLAGLNGSGNLTDSGWNGAKDTTSISGNPISISGLKSNQLAIDPIITFEPIQDLHGQSKPYPAGGGKNKYSDGNITISDTVYAGLELTSPILAGTYKASAILSSNITSSARLAFRRSDGSAITAVDVVYNASGRSISDSFTLPETAYRLYFYVAGLGESGSRTWTNIMVAPSDADQSYAPYENICPISGYDKAEVLSHKPILSYQHNTAIGSDGKPYTYESGMILNPKIDCKNGEVFYASFVRPSISIDLVCHCYGINNNYLGYSRITNSGYFIPSEVRSGCTSFILQINNSGTVDPSSYIFETTDISESLGQTVYGGSLDVRTGKFTVEFVKKVYDGSSDESWTKSTNAFYIAAHDLIKVFDYANSIKCDKLQLTSYFNIVDGSITNAIAGYKDSGGAYPGQNWIYIGASGISDVASLKTWLSNNPIEVVFELAKSVQIEIQLTPHEIPLLNDYAYLSTNGSLITLAYHNGELASLADVAQIGESLNALDKYINTSNAITSTQWFQVGKMVHVFWRGNVTFISTDDVVILSGLPRPSSAVYSNVILMFNTRVNQGYNFYDAVLQVVYSDDGKAIIKGSAFNSSGRVAVTATTLLSCICYIAE